MDVSRLDGSLRASLLALDEGAMPETERADRRDGADSPQANSGPS